jgi:HSP20 family protein
MPVTGAILPWLTKCVRISKADGEPVVRRISSGCRLVGQPWSATRGADDMNDIATSPANGLASRGGLPATSPASWLRNLLPNPLLDMTEDAKAYHLAVELPGLDEQDVEVTVADSTLAIAGEKKVTREEKTQDFLLRERHHGKFTRSLLIPADVDPARISASFHRGVMKITMPKDSKAAPRARKIAVTAVKE